jgi:thiosulfate reductase cytochrome b subunit
MEIIEKHPRAIRWFHWIHFPLLALMVWSGILIYWANDVYLPLPDSLVEKLGLGSRLAEGMNWHFFLVWLFALNGISYFIYLLVSGEWRFLLPDRKAWREAIPYLLYDLHLKKTGPAPRGKFNAMQRISYSLIVLMGAGSLLTGLAIYKPVQAGALTFILGGYPAARFEHFLLTVGFVLFFLLHVLQVTRAGWNNFRAMVAGYEIRK